MHGEWDGIDLDLLDPASEDERSILIRAAHPEYAEAIAEAGLGEVEVEGTNPRLHLAIHEVIATQLYNDDPPEVWPTAQRLSAMGYDWHDIHHALMHAITGQIYRTLNEEEEYDPRAYAAALEALPEAWEADLRDD
jgi:hypothetical protein